MNDLSKAALLGSLLLSFSVVSSSAAPTPVAKSYELFDEKAEFDHKVAMSGKVDSGIQVSLVLDFESTNRKVPGMANLDGLPIPAMFPVKKNVVIHLNPGPDGRYSVAFSTFLKTRLGTHYMLRHVTMQVDRGGQARSRVLLGTHVFFAQTGVPCESLKRVRLKTVEGDKLELQLDGDLPNLSKHTFGLIPKTGPETRMKLDVLR